MHTEAVTKYLGKYKNVKECIFFPQDFNAELFHTSGSVLTFDVALNSKTKP